MIRYRNDINGVKYGFLAMSALLVVLFFASPSAVRAEDGMQASTLSMPQSKDAVLVIRFNQKHVYFENALKKVVDKVSAIKPNASYEIQSIVPDDSGDTNARQYLENLRGVVAAFNQLGISKGRISVRTDVTDIVKSQEINIFVR